MGEQSSIERYLDYLKRMQRNKEKSLWSLHQQYVSRDTAREYGLTEEEILALDVSLRRKGEAAATVREQG